MSAEAARTANATLLECRPCPAVWQDVLEPVRVLFALSAGDEAMRLVLRHELAWLP
jgi:hypothetical protein